MSSKISQKDLRQMMRERNQLKTNHNKDNTDSGQESATKRIESPLVRYEANGRITCIVCDQYIAEDNVWSLHIVSKSHKNKLEEMKRKKLNQKTIESKVFDKKPEIKPLMKRKSETISDEISAKIPKPSVDMNTESFDKISNELMETNDTNDGNNSMSVTSGGETGLPNDFFDDPKQLNNESKESIESKDVEMETSFDGKSIPKGFFDDPVKDAKARKVVFKDPIDEQWEQFQKVIAEENNVSENIIEEEVEELQVDRNLEEIEEQIANWVKVNEMQKKVEILHNCIKKEEMDLNDESSDSDVDEQDLNVFSNWRSRRALNKK